LERTDMSLLMINGEERLSRWEPMTPLVAVLREEFSLTGTKDVCGEGFCGACTVLIDDRPALACLTPIGTAVGKSIQTIESMGTPDGQMSVVQQALLDADAVQCGMCFPGMVMALTYLVRQNSNPSEADIRAGLSGNLCRCTGYERIVEAAKTLAVAADQKAARS
jgi:carbon-monoxide dehydrogenase small subunit